MDTQRLATPSKYRNQSMIVVVLLLSDVVCVRVFPFLLLSQSRRMIQEQNRSQPQLLRSPYLVNTIQEREDKVGCDDDDDDGKKNDSLSRTFVVFRCEYNCCV